MVKTYCTTREYHLMKKERTKSVNVYYYDIVDYKHDLCKYKILFYIKMEVNDRFNVNN